MTNKTERDLLQKALDYALENNGFPCWGVHGKCKADDCPLAALEEYQA